MGQRGKTGPSIRTPGPVIPLYCPIFCVVFSNVDMLYQQAQFTPLILDIPIRTYVKMYCDENQFIASFIGYKWFGF